MSKEKRRFGDRRDATLIRQQDGMHLIMPMIYPNRCDNEAFISERIDLTNIDKYLEKRNAGKPRVQVHAFPPDCCRNTQNDHPASKAQPLHREQKQLSAQQLQCILCRQKTV